MAGGSSADAVLQNGAGPCNGWEEGRWGWSCVTMLLRALLEGVRDTLWVILSIYHYFGVISLSFFSGPFEKIAAR